jgi:hypothetical protein
MAPLTCAIAVVYVLILIRLVLICRDGFASPTKHAKTQEILGSHELFDPARASYLAAKSKMSWIDPVIYYDAVRLANRNALTYKNVSAVV